MPTETTEPLTLGRAIKAIREQAGETPAYTAEVLEISPRQLAQLESGERLPDPRLVDLVAELYGYDPLLLVAIARMEGPRPRGQLWSVTHHRALVLETLGLPRD